MIRELTLVLHTLGYPSFFRKEKKSCVRRKRRRRIEQYKNLNRLCSHFFFFFARRIKNKELIPTFPSFLIFSWLALFIIFLRLFYSRQTYTGGLSYSSSSSSLLYNAPISQIRKKETLADAWANISPFSTISSVCLSVLGSTVDVCLLK